MSPIGVQPYEQERSYIGEHPRNVVAVKTSFEQRFNDLKISTIQCLERMKIKITATVYILTQLGVRTECYQIFLKQNIAMLNQSQDHWALFGILNFHWSFLDYHLLDYLIDELCRTHHLFTDSIGTLQQSLTKVESMQSLTQVKEQMFLYKIDIEQFKLNTTMKSFCQDEQRNVSITEFFRRIFAQHRLSVHMYMTLKDVEDFRQRYVWHCNLLNCIRMLNCLILQQK